MSRGIALLFLGPRKSRWGLGSTPRPGRIYPGNNPLPIVQEAGWAPGPVWTGGNSRPHWDSIPDRPAHSQSLYQLSYPAHRYTILTIFICWQRKTFFIRMWHTHKGIQYCKLLIALANKAMFVSVLSSLGYIISNSRTTNVRNARPINPDRLTSCSHFFSFPSSKDSYTQPVNFNVHQTLSHWRIVILPITGEMNGLKVNRKNGIICISRRFHNMLIK